MMSSTQLHVLERLLRGDRLIGHRKAGHVRAKYRWPDGSAVPLNVLSALRSRGEIGDRAIDAGKVLVYVTQLGAERVG